MAPEVDGEHQRDVTVPRLNPATKWVCGYRDLGIQCAAGPDARGRCSLEQQCAQPRNGNQGWAPRPDCSTAPGAFANTPQPTGAVAQEDDFAHENVYPVNAEQLGPCVPTRAWWSARRVVASSLGVLTAAILLCCMALPQRDSIFVPGPLARSHAQILSGHDLSQRCGMCHPAAHQQADGLTQDALCMRCHQNHLPDAARRTPHDVTADQWRLLLASKQKTAEQPQDSMSTPHHQIDRATNCADCHREHHGADISLTHLADAQCQTCHAVQFAGFQHGHPDFRSYPRGTERRITFDHRTHRDRHFPKQDQPFRCNQCHVQRGASSLVGNVFRSRSFEQACASCHQAAIDADQTDGWAVIAIPSIAPDASPAEHAELSRWPDTARFGIEGEIPAPLRILLAGDPELVPALAALPPSNRLEDLPPEVRRRFGHAIAAGVARCMSELAAEGQLAWQRRLETVLKRILGRTMTTAERQLITRATAGIPPDLLLHIQRTWFAGSADHDAALRQPATRFQIAAFRSQEGLFDFNRSEHDQPADSSGDRTQTSTNDALGEIATLPSAERAIAGGWVLDRNTLTLRYHPSGHADPTLAAWGEIDALLRAVATCVRQDHNAKIMLDSLGIASATSTLPLPGDCQSCHNLAASSRPSDLLIGTPESPNNIELTNSAAGSNTRKPARPADLWRAVERPVDLRSFTRFNHAPHFTIPQLADCVHCHRLPEATGKGTAPVVDDLSAPDNTPGATAEFARIQIDQCVTCHGTGTASACTTCHLYHVGDDGIRWDEAAGPDRLAWTTGPAAIVAEPSPPDSEGNKDNAAE